MLRACMLIRENETHTHTRCEVERKKRTKTFYRNERFQ